jgi:hypothetical protein
MKTTEKCGNDCKRNLAVYGGKIREIISGSACVLGGRIFLKKFEKTHPHPPVVIYERNLEERD